jgi:hypothetical protein
MSPLSDFSPVLNPWLIASGEYVGPAEFRVEGGPVIHGQGCVTWDSTSGCRIVIEVTPSDVTHVAQYGMSDHPISQLRLVTADGMFEASRLMVANTNMHLGGSHPYSVTEEVKKWFPFDLLFELSLASGTHVNTGFIEIRDSSAQLVKRFHILPTEERYERGFRVINEVIDSGSSGSATVLGVADPDKVRLIRVVIGHLIRRRHGKKKMTCERHRTS